LSANNLSADSSPPGWAICRQTSCRRTSCQWASYHCTSFKCPCPLDRGFESRQGTRFFVVGLHAINCLICNFYCLRL
jgi:hypothetical protein